MPIFENIFGIVSGRSPVVDFTISDVLWESVVRPLNYVQGGDSLLS